MVTVQHPGRNTRHRSPFGHILDDDRPCADGRPTTDVHILHDAHRGTYVHLIGYHGRRVVVAPDGEELAQVAVVANHRTRIDHDADAVPYVKPVAYPRATWNLESVLARKPAVHQPRQRAEHIRARSQPQPKGVGKAMVAPRQGCKYNPRFP